MVKNISDVIERYLKDIMRQSEDGVVELQRSELAELFRCVPSQINYVISTRFTPEHGYIVESKRGGGGYIRIREVELGSRHTLMEALQKVGAELSQREAEGYIERLARDGILTPREAAMLRAMLRREVLMIDLPMRDQLRARLFGQMLQVVLLMDNEAES